MSDGGNFHYPSEHMTWFTVGTDGIYHTTLRVNPALAIFYLLMAVWRCCSTLVKGQVWKLKDYQWGPVNPRLSLSLSLSRGLYYLAIWVRTSAGILLGALQKGTGHAT